MIQLNHIDKYYNLGQTKVHALRDVSLSIGEGELIAVKGRSGAGKSSLLQILSCLDTFENGEYIFCDQQVQSLNNDKTAKLRNQHIGIVLQDFSLINYKSVLFNVTLPLFFSKTPYKKMKSIAKQMLERVGIEDQIDKKINQLSGGQRQRVAIARAIVNNPKLLLADEPTGALDTKTSQEIMNLFIELNKAGTTVVIVTHDPVIANCCKRQILIENGSIIQDISI